MTPDQLNAQFGIDDVGAFDQGVALVVLHKSWTPSRWPSIWSAVAATPLWLVARPLLPHPPAARSQSGVAARRGGHAAALQNSNVANDKRRFARDSYHAGKMCRTTRATPWDEGGYVHTSPVRAL